MFTHRSELNPLWESPIQLRKLKDLPTDINLVTNYLMMKYSAEDVIRFRGWLKGTKWSPEGIYFGRGLVISSAAEHCFPEIRQARLNIEQTITHPIILLLPSWVLVRIGKTANKIFPSHQAK